MFAKDRSSRLRRCKGLACAIPDHVPFRFRDHCKQLQGEFARPRVVGDSDIHVSIEEGR